MDTKQNEYQQLLMTLDKIYQGAVDILITKGDCLEEEELAGCLSGLPLYKGRKPPRVIETLSFDSNEKSGLRRSLSLLGAQGTIPVVKMKMQKGDNGYVEVRLAGDSRKKKKPVEVLIIDFPLAQNNESTAEQSRFVWPTALAPGHLTPSENVFPDAMTMVDLLEKSIDVIESWAKSGIVN